MCKACRLDPKDMRRELQRRGAVDPEDFYQETPHKKSSQRKRPKRGCPGNDYKEHVYVEVPVCGGWYQVFYDYWGFWKWSREVCAGCDRSKRARLSPEYRAKFGNKSWVDLQDADYKRVLTQRHA